MASPVWHTRAIRMRKERNLTYQQIATQLGKSWSAVYFVVNPKKRSASTPSGDRRTIYIDDDLWYGVGAAAKKAGVSRSRYIVQVLEGSRSVPKDEEPEPVIPGVEVAGPPSAT